MFEKIIPAPSQFWPEPSNSSAELDKLGGDLELKSKASTVIPERNGANRTWDALLALIQSINRLPTGKGCCPPFPIGGDAAQPPS